MAKQTEAFARTLIDAQLGDQHWQISDGTSVRYEYTLPNGDRADYMLCSREGRGHPQKCSSSLSKMLNESAPLNPSNPPPQQRHKPPLTRCWPMPSRLHKWQPYS